MSAQVKELGNYLQQLFKHQLEVKIYHFQTKSYGAHKASDGYLVKYLANFDQLMEVGQGSFGQVTLSKVTVNFTTWSDKNAQSNLDRYLQLLEKMQISYENYPEITSILDVMMSDAQQFKYLLLFK